MFTTFYGATPNEPQPADLKPAVSTPRPKRSQINRACDWCRLTRVKCDASRPCRNCKQANRQCGTDGQNGFRSVAAATREVERLRAQVHDLEAKLNQNPDAAPTPSSLAQTRVISSPSEAHLPRPPVWKGVHIGSVYYGVSSQPFFIKRMFAFLSTTLQQSDLDMIPYPDPGVSNVPNFSLGDCVNCDYLQRSQQDYFLDLFWQAYHAIIPVVNEAEFRDHYHGLWGESIDGGCRKPSPLVDIVLALCIQFGSSFIPRADFDGPSTSPGQTQADATLAGSVYYQRCHALLNQSMETPTIVSVKCYIFSIIYLLNAGLPNTAHAIASKAIRTATILGLNDEHVSDEPESQKDLKRRIWWTLYILDTQLSVDLGHSWMISPLQSACRPPSESPEIANSLGSSYNLSTESDITWLGFQNHTLRLAETMRTIHDAFYGKCNDIINEIDAQDFYASGEAREKCARFLIEQMKKLKAWTRQVPADYKTPRKSGEPLSTDRSPIDFDQTAPLWLQRQRLILELQYHDSALNLYRQFICFSPTPATGTPLSDNNAISSLNHAITVTNMIHQVLVESDVLNGWHQIFRWQRNAVFVLLGFAFAYPVCPPTPSARKAITTAISVFEVFGANFAAATRAANLTRRLVEKADAILDRFRNLLPATPSSGPPSLVNVDQSSTKSNPSPKETPAATVGPNATGFDLSFSEPLPTVGDMDSIWMGLDLAGRSDLWDSFMKDIDASAGEPTIIDIAEMMNE